MSGYIDTGTGMKKCTRMDGTYHNCGIEHVVDR